jgi:hypothetical protein
LDAFKNLKVTNGGDVKKDANSRVKLDAPINLSQQNYQLHKEETPDWAKIQEKPTLVDSEKLSALNERKKKQRDVRD